MQVLLYICHPLYASSFSQLTLENVYKSSENVSFCYCTEITIALKKIYPQKIVYEVDQELGGRVLSPARPRVGKIPPGKEKNANSRGYTEKAYGGGKVTV